MDSKTPTPCNWKREAIENLAAKVAEAGGFQVAGDVAKLVRSFGGKVEILDYDEWIEQAGTGTIEIEGKHKFRILIPRFTSPTRDRFTIAHELGHYFLHSRQGEVVPMRIQRNGGGRVESEANAFAGALLMPEAEFRTRAAEFRERHRDSALVMLAGHFDVSADAARVRSEVLGVSLQ